MQNPVHPLEPLSAEEIQLAVAILKDAGRVTKTTRFVSISLREPNKALVHSFDGRQTIPREAFAVLFDNATNSCHEAIISLAKRELAGWKHIPGVQPTMTIDEQIECEQAVLASPEFKSALKKQYGIDDTSLMMVDIWSAGYYGEPEEANRRLARPLCFVRSDPTDNGYVRPIEGIRPVVDLNEMKVIRVEEYGHWPLPPVTANYAADRVPNQRTDIKPLDIAQPAGPSFTVDGNTVKWQNWSFTIGFNAREGLTLHHLRYNDRGKERSILYRASLTEMVVPYGDPGPTQFRKNAFDVGEYGMGMCANSLELGCDCPGPDSLLRCPSLHKSRRAVDHQERDLHARGGFWHPVEAYRSPAESARSAPIAAAGRVFDLDRRELRIRLLLVPLSRWQYPVRDQADRHPVARRHCSRGRHHRTER